MKKLQNILILLLIPIASNSQDLFQVALKDETLIIKSEAFEISERLKSLDIRSVNEEFHVIDKTLLEDLKRQSEKEQKSKWKKTDFKDRFVLNPNEKINLDSIKKILNSFDKKVKKDLVREFKKYNAGEVFHRSFPLSVSKPIYSSDGNFAIIGFSKGNNGGQIVLYKRTDDDWKFEATLDRWAY